MRDRAVEILISTTFRIHRDIRFFSTTGPKVDFFGKLFCSITYGHTSLVDKD